MRLHVDSMHCEGCVRGVTKAAHRVDAEADVAVDLAEKTVEIRSGRPPEDFLQALAAAGFPAALA